MTPWLASSFAFAAEVCAAFGDAGDSVAVEDIPVAESSGVAYGGDDVYYTLDDEDGPHSLFGFTLDGTYVREQVISNAENVDWEDLASGPCPANVDADTCLWIGDIGDNDEVRDDIVLYVVPRSGNLSETAVACRLHYPEGKRYDAETLLVDPDGLVRIVTKEKDGEAHVFRIDAPTCDGEAQTLEEEAQITFGEPVTGGAISEDGLSIVLRSNADAWMWTGCVNWARKPDTVELGAEEQGEGITFAPDGSLVTTSEGDPMRVWDVPCEKTKEATCPDCGCGGSSAAVWVLLPLAWSRRRR